MVQMGRRTAADELRGLLAGDAGVLLEVGIVAGGEVAAEVCAAAFFAGEGAAGYQRGDGVQVAQFERGSVLDRSKRCAEAGELGCHAFETFGVTQQAGIAPHGRAQLSQRSRAALARSVAIRPFGVRLSRRG